ncbi:3-deoxy-7-phosphoheptulonate synthase [Pelagicoccus sp. SDUM812002]|uniref:3-deoxy-7-phosphoheptulonate synthase n=1 Tax=Pelagicoccus sp. SDUM812002 TaxID=3041266 RepID=UPI00280C9977|nr:3-deoxy-7-phosphoheptulonate synthase [Pelagicoccus sp. SDUM812002]MDQ8187523.1 3-deoxy-7-phosphoheptulonate synthase [Pelagicoccus sp. SDUM812002]
MNSTLPSVQDPDQDDINSPTLAQTEPIQVPSKIKRDIPLSESAKTTVAKARQEISDILTGRDEERMVVVCGPCSVDDVNAAHVYAERLRKLSERVDEKLVVVMRTYFEKPRSVVGWKGLLYDPLTEVQNSPMAGICMARRLAARINDSGLPCATEFLNPLLALYLEDCISYGSIGSRTVESQIHRELASRLALPMGMKNGMSGEMGSATNAIESARSPHRFFGSGMDGEACVVETKGNRNTHLILRGGSNGPNFEAESVQAAADAGRQLGLSRPVVVDCSHGNSQKNHRNQATVVEEVIRQVANGQKGLAGVMLESYLVEGRQDLARGNTRCFGQSITDACIGWKDTEYLVCRLAKAL